MAKFQPDVSGNPGGKPKGAKDKRTAVQIAMKRSNYAGLGVDVVRF